MDLDCIMHSEASQTNTVCYHLYVESKKKSNEYNRKTYRYSEQTITEQTSGYRLEEGRGEGHDSGRG